MHELIEMSRFALEQFEPLDKQKKLSMNWLPASPANTRVPEKQNQDKGKIAALKAGRDLQNKAGYESEGKGSPALVFAPSAPQEARDVFIFRMLNTALVH